MMNQIGKCVLLFRLQMSGEIPYSRFAQCLWIEEWNIYPQRTSSFLNNKKTQSETRT